MIYSKSERRKVIPEHFGGSHFGGTYFKFGKMFIFEKMLPLVA
jgi:hypothetical protein